MTDFAHKEYPGLSVAIASGAYIHAFRSGGGLRVVRLETTKDPKAWDKLIGYGEHPHIEGAMAHCEEDFLAGGRKYEDVYGPIHTHYLTGESSPSSEVDRWVLAGRPFDIFSRDGEFVFSGRYSRRSIPRHFFDRVARSGVAEQFTDDIGFTYDIKPSCFANGDRSASASVVSIPDGYSRHDAFDHYKNIELRSKKLAGLLNWMESEIPATFDH